MFYDGAAYSWLALNWRKADCQRNRQDEEQWQIFGPVPIQNNKIYPILRERTEEKRRLQCINK